MNGQHARPTLTYRLGDAIERFFGKHTDRLAGLNSDPISPRPVVLDHIHRLNSAGACYDSRCWFDTRHDPRNERVVPIPSGEPEWMPGQRRPA